MSVFGGEDRILLEEIVETTEEQETNLCGSIGTIEESSVTTSVTVAEVADSQEQQQQQSKSNGAVSRRVAGQNVALSNGNSTSNVGRVTPRSHMEQEKRMRREIANSNERRRMQSINAGFQSLRTLLPHHEGEKLSKAAILQQTAEYIYQLEQEKTQLLSQNCQLKRLVNQHEGGDVPIKKRKPDNQGGVVVSLPMHVSESGDEGLGSMSPEPLSVITVTTEGHSVVNSEVVELRRQLERERHARLHLEKQMRAIQSQLYPERFRDNQLITYQPHEVIEHTDNVIAQETEEAVAALQVVSVVSLAPVGTTQTVDTSSPDPSSPPLSPQPADMVPEEIKEEETGPGSPKIVTFGQNQVFSAIDEQTTGDSFSSSSRVTYATTTGEFKNASPQYITTSPSRPFSPTAEPQRLPSVLEAAMKAEPKVEVERLPSPSNSLDDSSPQARLYLANTSRQNLETIVEAIRHLEGDHLFSDEPAQDMPLALTNKQTANTSSKSSTTPGASPTAKQRLLQAEFLQFHRQQQAQQRPGVIVVKHS
ncbi:transcription factor cropped isoform X1 [Bombus vancouverensis nearcticus]|uniref:Helix-loop-helix protein 11 isoform X1 n=1 Tax=Bombus bifarius TaxID=103933 RepID=A0A6P8MML3_9HYME|nr:helix-loop-helix protein 11 isoform X1 [Bombus vancouverensis nearcticus]XP_033303795.1 helix-loop-helix protein 11 isoform X1 [Bombus bifarius]